MLINLQSQPTPVLFQRGPLAFPPVSFAVQITGSIWKTMFLPGNSPVNIIPALSSGNVNSLEIPGPTLFTCRFSEGLKVNGPHVTGLKFPDLVGCSETLEFLAFTELASLEFPALRAVNFANFDALPALALLDLSALEIANSGLQITLATFAGTLSLPALVSTGSLFLQIPNLGDMDFSALKYCDSMDLAVGALDIHFPALVECANTITVQPGFGAELIAFISLENCGDIIVSGGALTALSFGGAGGALKSVGQVDASNNALDVDGVDNILAALAGLDGTAGRILWANTCNLSGGTNAHPSGAGLADRAILLGRGATVLIN